MKLPNTHVNPTGRRRRHIVRDNLRALVDLWTNGYRGTVVAFVMAAVALVVSVTCLVVTIAGKS